MRKKREQRPSADRVHAEGRLTFLVLMVFLLVHSLSTREVVLIEKIVKRVKSLRKDNEDAECGAIAFYRFLFVPF